MRGTGDIVRPGMRKIERRILVCGYSYSVLMAYSFLCSLDERINMIASM